ncbi:unnamed protein product, partial [Prorocentrum cordatum]
SPHRGARDAHAALLSLRAGPRSSTLQTAKTAAPAARAAAAVQCERAGGARRRLERAGAQKPKACWAVRGGDEAGGEGERNRRGGGGEAQEGDRRTQVAVGWLAHQTKRERLPAARHSPTPP